MKSSLIEKLTIIEFASVLAGPLTGSFFAELGAKVIKIENPKTNGDITRSWKARNEDPNTSVSAYYASANYGKKNMFLDLGLEEDRKTAYSLCEEADVVITNFKPSSARKLGLTYADVQSINPSIIYGEIQSYPEEKDKPAFDVLLQAETGYMAMCGFPDRPFAKIPVAMIDVLASHQLREGILIALLERMNDQKGRRVSVNLYEAALSGLINQASDYLMNGNIPKPLGSQHPHIAPYGDIFLTKDDKPLVLAIGTDRKFFRLLDLLDLEAFYERFNTNEKRVESRENLNEELQKAISEWDWEELSKKLEDAGIPSTTIKNLDQVFEKESGSGVVLQEFIEGRKCMKTRTSVFRINTD